MDANVGTIAGRSDLSGLYHLGRTLGRGHFAVVKLARQVNTGQLVAVKMIDKTKLDVLATSHLLQEVRCMRLVQHPNVVRLYEVIDTPTTLHLIMELAEGGDLYDYILRHEGGVAEGTAKRHFAQIVRAVAYCHQLHVVHRDLKPENVVFFPQQGAVKLTDFGFSNLFQPGTMLATSCGSLAYSAPEILLGEEYDAPAVDIWSLGVILYMLVCGVPPFQETNDSETLVMILDCRYSVPSHVSDGCKDLISKMLQKDPSRRASLDEIEAHDWLRGLDNALLSPEAPPPWLTGALSLSSPRSGVPECGDLLASKPPPPQGFPGLQNLSFTLRPPPPPPAPPPVEEPPAAAKNLPPLQQICEEEEEEGEAEDDDINDNNDSDVISDQPLSHAETKLSNPLLTSLPRLMAPCCQGQPDDAKDEKDVEPNNNTNKPESSAGPVVNRNDDEDKPRDDSDAAKDELITDRSQPHNATGQRDDAANAVQGKRHGVKLRERLFQFPLCEKALAFNIPTHNKPKILPLTQYNCCHVL